MITGTSAAAKSHDLAVLLGQRIREVRQSSGMTQGELAEALSPRLGESISRSTLGNYETGRRPMSAELLLLIADVCGVPLQAFALTMSGATSETTAQAVELQKHTTAPPSTAGDEAVNYRGACVDQPDSPGTTRCCAVRAGNDCRVRRGHARAMTVGRALHHRQNRAAAVQPARPS